MVTLVQTIRHHIARYLEKVGMAARIKRLFRYVTLMAKLFGGASELKMGLHDLLPFFSCSFSHGRFSLDENLIV